MKQHPYYENYFVYEDGRIFGPRKELKPISHHSGYAVLTVRKNGKAKNYRWHRFVWEAFNGEIPPDKVINHKDGDKHNNSVENLEVLTSQENTQHAFSIGLMKGKPGELNPVSKLTNKQARSLIEDLLNGMSNTEAGEKYSLHPGYISLVRHKHRWKTLWEDIESSTTIPTGSRA